MKNPFKQMKQLRGAVVVMMYEIYLAGVQDGRNGGKMPPLKAFCKESKNVHRRGQEISKKMSEHGERADTVDAAEKGSRA